MNDFSYPEYTLSPFFYNGEEGCLALILRITHYLHVPPWRGSVHTCYSDEDFYGYTNIEWEIVQATFIPFDRDTVKEISCTLNLLSGEQSGKVEEYLKQFMFDVSREQDEDVICNIVSKY